MARSVSACDGGDRMFVYRPKDRGDYNLGSIFALDQSLVRICPFAKSDLRFCQFVTVPVLSLATKDLNLEELSEDLRVAVRLGIRASANSAGRVSITFRQLRQAYVDDLLLRDRIVDQRCFGRIRDLLDHPLLVLRGAVMGRLVVRSAPAFDARRISQVQHINGTTLRMDDKNNFEAGEDQPRIWFLMYAEVDAMESEDIYNKDFGAFMNYVSDSGYKRFEIFDRDKWEQRLVKAGVVNGLNSGEFRLLVPRLKDVP
jgi:hypothetical protein